MQRLTRPARSAPPSLARPDDGAVAVIVSLLLVVLIGFVGLGVDVTAAYAKTQEAQNGADAAALGLAQACATDELTCPGTGDQSMAHGLATANVRHQVDTVTTAVDYPAATQVRATVSAESENAFVRLFGVDSFTVREQATAAWGAPTRGVSGLPLTFSLCQFDKQGGSSGAAATVYLTKSSDAECVLPTSGNTMPGGFGYIGDGGSCGAEVSVDGWVEATTGNTPKDCSASELTPLVGEVVLLPIFDACVTKNPKNAPGCTASGSPAGDRAYRIHAFAAFELHGFNFGGSYKTGSPVPCGGSERCIRGRFVEWVSLADAFEYGTGPNLGASVVTLVD